MSVSTLESAARNTWAADGPVARLMWIARAGARKYGITIDEIMRRWDVSRRTAQRDLARLRRIGYVAYAADANGMSDAYRLEPPSLVVATADATLVATMRAYQETQSIYVAAEKIGVSHETVRLRLRAAKERGFDVLLPHEARRERKMRKEARRQAHRDAKRAAKRDYVEELREISRQLGYVPSTTTLQFGSKPGAQSRRERGEHATLYTALHRSQSVPKLLDIIGAELGLPRERRQRGPIAGEQKPSNADPKRTRKRLSVDAHS